MQQQEYCCAKLLGVLHLSRLVASHHATRSVKGIVVISRGFGRSVPGKSATVQLYSITQIDPKTGRGKRSEEASLRKGKKAKQGEAKTMTYRVSFRVEPEFGIPGALVVKNGHRDEFFLKSVTLETSDKNSIHFDCNSWVYPLKRTNADRLFFANTIYLPRDTPVALRELRQEELVNLRGTGRGERKEWERVYDYDRYNDLGNPHKGLHHVRPALGGSKTYPYPRRCRTGRPLTTLDGTTETRHGVVNLDFYVPPDERFSPNKLSDFISNSVQAIVHFVIPEVKSMFEGDPGNFESFDQIMKDLYSDGRSCVLEGLVMEKVKSFLPEELFREVLRVIKENPVKFPAPQIVETDEFAWKSDEEFAREMLAGLNPVVIKRLEKFPPEGRGGKKSSITPAHIENNLDGLDILEAFPSRLFILDHHDYLMPYLRRINAQGVCVYASRTLLFLRNDETLKPIAIELSSPGDRDGEEMNRVFLPASGGSVGALWQLAKAHVAVNDSGYHQLISHWLNTHAVVEPFIIATRRQLSSMHPVHKLLDPHFKDTMHINALARGILLNSGGILEKTMFPGKFSMELSSVIYEDWQFEEQALPADLLKRGLAVKDSSQPSGVRLRFEDYPYAADGLDIWIAIEKWVTHFCKYFYASDDSISSDAEIQAWWTEIKQVGHGDKRDDEGWWYQLNTLSNLTQALTTLIWIASALHASVNFGQYGYAGFPPNRPIRCRKFIPEEGTIEFAEFLRDPDKYYLEMLSDRFTTTVGLALIEVLSRHASDEVYMGQRASARWTDDKEVLRMFGEFSEDLKQVERRINERNLDSRLKNRLGPARIPYTLLYPDTSIVGSERGITGKGIPNSVSI